MLEFTVQSESEWSRSWNAQLRLCNATILSIVGNRMQTSGWPDRYIHHTIFCGFVEVKRAGNSLSKNQEILIRELNLKQPASAFVLWLNDELTTLKFRPQHVQWFHGNEWPYRDISHLNHTLELLQLLAHVQRQARGIAETIA